MPEPQLQLTALEARVLGALMEKEVTTPDQYPLSINSLKLACNQKSIGTRSWKRMNRPFRKP